ncbi:MAG: hypothetical protein Q4G28_09880 [Neisseria sp.]|nr:hypothetical protein [Neisseria sp.]
MQKITVAPAQAGAQSEAKLQLELASFENLQPNDSSWIFRIRKIGGQAKLCFALGTRLRVRQAGNFAKVSALLCLMVCVRIFLIYIEGKLTLIQGSKPQTVQVVRPGAATLYQTNGTAINSDTRRANAVAETHFFDYTN